jgi:nitrate/TMAO reductase-like tetraheme cytochrome c subunit
MGKALCGLAVLLWALGAAAEPPNSSCITCHAALEGKFAQPAKLFASDVHHRTGLDCADCHGGDPADMSMNAMRPAKGFRGVSPKSQIPEFCAHCHSDPNYMRRFNPDLRTDQLSQYWTSVHGKRLKRGDAKVATCVDCHSVHDILAVSDTRAPVYPTNVATTCARCHADAAYMKGYDVSTDQLALYEKSVHAQTLAGGDTSAPTCSTCHGNHGATPPGVSSVANVCGTCHVMNEQLFDKSPHQAAFAKMGLPGCVQCHSNHEIVRPTDAWVGSAPQSVCTTCHAPGDKGYTAAQAMSADLAHLDSSLTRAQEVLDVAERAGMEVSGAKLELTDANEALVKARVNVHTFDEAAVRKLTEAGVEIAAKSYQAGVAALRERDVRRKGLGIALIAIVLAISGLYLKIRQMESGSS